MQHGHTARNEVVVNGGKGSPLRSCKVINGFAIANPTHGCPEDPEIAGAAPSSVVLEGHVVDVWFTHFPWSVICFFCGFHPQWFRPWLGHSFWLGASGSPFQLIGLQENANTHGSRHGFLDSWTKSYWNAQRITSHGLFQNWNTKTQTITSQTLTNIAPHNWSPKTPVSS